MRDSNERGSLHVTIAIAVFVLVAGLIGWRVWSAMDNGSDTASDTPAVVAPLKTLKINEWGVELPLASSIEKAQYKLGSRGTYAVADLTLDGLGCSYGASGSIVQFSDLSNMIDGPNGQVAIESAYGPSKRADGNYYAYIPPLDACLDKEFSESKSTVFKAAVQQLKGFGSQKSLSQLATEGITAARDGDYSLALKDWKVGTKTAISFSPHFITDGDNTVYLGSVELEAADSSDCKLGRNEAGTYLNPLGRIFRYANDAGVNGMTIDAYAKSQASYRQVGSYYYVYVAPQGQCSQKETANQMQQSQVEAIKQLVSTLEPMQ